MRKKLIPFLLISMFFCGCSGEQTNSSISVTPPAPEIYEDQGVTGASDDSESADDETYLRAYPIAYDEEFSGGDGLLQHISFTIGDDVYRLGDHIEYYTNTGWEIKKNISVTKEGIDELTHEGYEGSLLIGVYNPEETPVTTEDSYVFRVSSKVQETGGLPVFLPGGFTWNSNVADILNVYGEPDEIFCIEESVLHTYVRGRITLTLGYTDEKLSSVWFESETPE